MDVAEAKEVESAGELIGTFSESKPGQKFATPSPGYGDR